MANEIIPGFHRERLEGVNHLEYFSFKKIDLMLDSPRAFFDTYRPREKKPEEGISEAMELGKLFHLAALEPKKFREKMVIEPIFEAPTADGKMSQQSKGAREQRAAWTKEQIEAGRVIVDEDQLDKIVECVEMVLDHEEAMKLLTGGRSEGWLYVWDEIFGRYQLCRGDFLTNKFETVEVKTTTKSIMNKRAWGREVFNMNYHVQMAHNARGAALHFAQDPVSFEMVKRKGIWIVIKTTRPFDVKVFTASENMMLAGESKCFRAYHKINDHLEADPELLDKRCWPMAQFHDGKHHAEEVDFEPWQLRDDPDYEALTQLQQP